MKFPTSCINPWVIGKVEENPNQRLYYLAAFLEQLQKPRDLETNPYWQTDIGKRKLRMTNHVIAEFFRSEFDSKYQGWKLIGRGKGAQELKTIIRAEAALWSAVWHVLERLESMGRLPRLPLEGLPSRIPKAPIVPVWLFCMALEGELILSMFLNDDGTGTATTLISSRQAFNQKIHKADWENPAHLSFTRAFLEAAASTADQYDQFRKKQFKPMVDARMAVTAELDKNRARLFNRDGRMLYQGRRKSRN